ncbi:MAG TPA: acyl carrier protein [Polyangia bacterium]
MKKADLQQWLGGVFQEDPASLGLDRARATIPTWDSMGTLLLIAELDEKLKVTLSEDELKELTSIGDIVAVLSRKGVAVVD